MKVVLLVTTILILSGCSTFRFPGVHRISIQQGNVISQVMIDKLKPGMSKSQVRFILGNPVIDDSLRQDQWDYIYSIQFAGGTPAVRTLTLHFIEQRLSYFEGDFAPPPKADDEPDESAKGTAAS